MAERADVSPPAWQTVLLGHSNNCNCVFTCIVEGQVRSILGISISVLLTAYAGIACKSRYSDTLSEKQGLETQVSPKGES